MTNSALYNQAVATNPSRVIMLNGQFRRGLIDQETYDLGLATASGQTFEAGKADAIVGGYLNRLRQDPTLIKNQPLLGIISELQPRLQNKFSIPEAAMQVAQEGAAEQMQMAQQRAQDRAGRLSAVSYYGPQGAAELEALGASEGDVFDMLKNAGQVEKAIAVYNERPELFTLEHARQLETLAGRYNLAFNPFPTAEHATALGVGGKRSWKEIFAGATVESIVEQGVAGAVEGFTTIPDENVAPAKNLAEEFARGIGHLVGFTGFRTHLSVPMIGAQVLSEATGTAKLANLVRNRLVNAGAKGQIAHAVSGMVGGSFNLGYAMAISSRLGGPSAMLDGMLGGMKAGAFFSLLKMAPGNEKSMKVLGALGGAAWEGIPTLREQGFTPQSLYDMLLGAYFGYGEGAHGYKLKTDPMFATTLHEYIDRTPELKRILGQQFPEALNQIGGSATGIVAAGANVRKPNVHRGGTPDYHHLVTITADGSNQFLASNLSQYGIEVQTVDGSRDIWEGVKKKLTKTPYGTGEDKAKMSDSDAKKVIDEIKTAFRAASEPEYESAIDAINTRLSSEFGRSFDLKGAIGDEVLGRLFDSTRSSLRNANMLVLFDDAFEAGMQINDVKSLIGKSIYFPQHGKPKDARVSRDNLLSLISGETGSDTRPVLFIGKGGRVYAFKNQILSGKLEEVPRDEIDNYHPTNSDDGKIRLYLHVGEPNKSSTFNKGIDELLGRIIDKGNKAHRELDSAGTVWASGTNFRGVSNIALAASSSPGEYLLEDRFNKVRFSFDPSGIAVRMTNKDGSPVERSRIKLAIDHLTSHFNAKYGVTPELTEVNGVIKIGKKMGGRDLHAVTPATILDFIGRARPDGVGTPFFHNNNLSGVRLDPRLSTGMQYNSDTFQKAMEISRTDHNLRGTAEGLVIELAPVINDGSDASRPVYIRFDQSGVTVNIPGTIDEAGKRVANIQIRDMVNNILTELVTSGEIANRGIKVVQRGVPEGSISLLTSQTEAADLDVAGKNLGDPSHGYVELVAKFNPWVPSTTGRNNAYDIYDLVYKYFSNYNVRFGATAFSGERRDQAAKTLFVDPSAVLNSLGDAQVQANKLGLSVDFRTDKSFGVLTLEDVMASSYNTFSTLVDRFKQMRSDAYSMKPDDWFRKITGAAPGKSTTDMAGEYIYGQDRWKLVRAIVKNTYKGRPQEMAEAMKKLQLNVVLKMHSFYNAARNTLVSGVPIDAGGGVSRLSVFNIWEKVDESGNRVRDFSSPPSLNIHGKGDVAEDDAVFRTGTNMSGGTAFIDASAATLSLVENGLEITPAQLRKAIRSGEGFIYDPINSLGDFLGNPREAIEIMSHLFHSSSISGYIPIGMLSSVGSPEVTLVEYRKYEGNARALFRDYAKQLAKGKASVSRSIGKVFEDLVATFKNGELADEADMKEFGLKDALPILPPSRTEAEAEAKAYAYIRAIGAIDPGILVDPVKSDMIAAGKWAKRLGNMSPKNNFFRVNDIVEELNAQETMNAAANGTQPYLRDKLTFDIMPDVFRSDSQFDPVTGTLLLSKKSETTNGIIYVRQEVLAQFQRQFAKSLDADADSAYAIKALVQRYFPNVKNAVLKSSMQPMSPWMEHMYFEKFGKEAPDMIAMGSTFKTSEVLAEDFANHGNEHLYIPLKDQYVEVLTRSGNRHRYLTIERDADIQGIFGQNETDTKLAWQTQNFLDPAATQFRSDRLNTTFDDSTASGQAVLGAMRGAYKELIDGITQLVGNTKSEAATDPRKLAEKILIDAISSDQTTLGIRSAIHQGLDPLNPVLFHELSKQMISTLADSLFGLRLKRQGTMSVLADEMLGYTTRTGQNLVDKVYTHGDNPTEIQLGDLIRDGHIVKRDIDVPSFKMATASTRGELWQKRNAFVLGDDSIILSWGDRQSAENPNGFKVGDEVMVFRVPIGRGSGIVKLKVAGFQAEGSAHNVKVSAGRVVRSFEGDWDIDKVFVVRDARRDPSGAILDKAEISIEKILDLIGMDQWADHSLNIPLEAFEIVSRNKEENKPDSKGNYKKRNTIFSPSSIARTLVTTGNGSSNISKIANTMRVIRTLKQNSRWIEIQAAGRKITLKPVEDGDVVIKARMADGTEAELNYQQYMGVLLQAAVDDVKYFGISSRRKYTLANGTVIDNPLFYDRIENLSRIFRVEIDGVAVNDSVAAGEIIDQATKLEWMLNSVIRGKDPNNGRSYEAVDVYDIATMIESLRVGGDAIDAYMSDTLKPLFASQSARIENRLNRIASKYPMAGEIIARSKIDTIRTLLDERDGIGKFLTDDLVDTPAFNAVNRFFDSLAAAGKDANPSTSIDRAIKQLEREFNAISVTVTRDAQRRVAAGERYWGPKIPAIESMLEKISAQELGWLSGDGTFRIITTNPGLVKQKSGEYILLLDVQKAIKSGNKPIDGGIFMLGDETTQIARELFAERGLDLSSASEFDVRSEMAKADSRFHRDLYLRVSRGDTAVAVERILATLTETSAREGFSPEVLFSDKAEFIRNPDLLAETINSSLARHFFGRLLDGIGSRPGVAEAIVRMNSRTTKSSSEVVNRIMEEIREPMNDIRSYVEEVAKFDSGERIIREILKDVEPGGVRVGGTYGEDPMSQLILQSKDLLSFAGKDAAGNDIPPLPMNEMVRMSHEAVGDARSQYLYRLTDPNNQSSPFYGLPNASAIVDSADASARSLVEFISKANKLSNNKSSRSVDDMRRYLISLSKSNPRLSTIVRKSIGVVDDNVNLNKIVGREYLAFVTSRMIEEYGGILSSKSGLGILDANVVFTELTLSHALDSMSIELPGYGKPRVESVMNLMPGISGYVRGKSVPLSVMRHGHASTFIESYNERYQAKMNEALARNAEMAAANPTPTAPQTQADIVAQQTAQYVNMKFDVKRLTIESGGRILFKADRAELEKASPKALAVVEDMIKILRDQPEIRAHFRQLVDSLAMEEFAPLFGRGWDGAKGEGITTVNDMLRVHSYLKHVLLNPDPRVKFFYGLLSKGHVFPEVAAKRLAMLSFVVNNTGKLGDNSIELMSPLTSIINDGNEAQRVFAVEDGKYKIRIDEIRARAHEGITPDRVKIESRLAGALLDSGNVMNGEWAEATADRAYWARHPERHAKIRELYTSIRQFLTEFRQEIVDHYHTKEFRFPDGEIAGKGLINATDSLSNMFGVNFRVTDPSFVKDDYFPRFYERTQDVVAAARRYVLAQRTPSNLVEAEVAKIVSNFSTPDVTYSNDGLVPTDRRVSFLRHRGKEPLGGYSMDAIFAIEKYASSWARKKAYDEFSLRSVYVMQSMLNNTSPLGARIADRLADVSVKDRKDWVAYMDRLTRNAIGYSSQGNEKFFGMDLNDKTWAPRLAKLYKSITGNELQDPEGFLKKLASIEGSYQLMALLAFPKAMLGNMLGGNLNLIKQISYADWKMAGVMMRDIMKSAKSDEDILSAIRRRVGNYDAIKGDSGYLAEELRKVLQSPAILANFIQYEAELSKYYDSGSVKLALADLRDGKGVKETLSKYGIGQNVWDRMTGFGAKVFGSVEYKLRARTFIAGFIHSYQRLGLDVDSSVKHGLKLVRKTQYAYDALNMPEFRNSALGKIVTRFQPWAWNQFRLESDIINEAKELGFSPGSREYERFTKTMAINGTLLALAAFLPFSLFGSSVPPPYSYGLSLAQAVWGDDDKEMFAGTYAISTITGPTLNNLVVAPMLSLMTEGYGYNPWVTLPFGRALGATYRTLKRPQFGIDYWTGVPVMDLHKALFQEEAKAPAQRSISAIMRSPTQEAEEDM